MARIDVVMPKMGESVMEGTVLTWFKQPGEKIDTDEALLEIGTDKVDSEIPSPASGTVAEILVSEGDTVEVGTVLARLETDADVIVDFTPSVDSPDVKEAAPTETGAMEPSPGTEASPAATAPAARAGHVIEIVMPKMGESIMEG
ncbi:MAG: biotin/lipoyl-containing protein, partial [Rhodothermia bacterium]